MWARIVEILLGIWLLFSHFFFGVDGAADIYCAILIILFGAFSYIEKLNKMHLLQVIPIGWLFFLSYNYPTHILPFYLQNYILTALSLLMFCIIPSHASDHPNAWKKFLNGQ